MKYKNNPLNIRFTNKSKWLGLTGAKNGFCEFSSIEYGVRTGLYLLLKTYKKRGWISIKDIVDHWAPESDGNNPAMYLFYITSRCGVMEFASFYCLPRDLQFYVVRQMCLIESGYYLSKDIFDKSYSLL